MVSNTKFVGNPQALRDWQARMGFTYDTAAAALGMSRSAYANMVAIGAEPSYIPRIDLRTALACAAIERGIKPI